MAVAKKRIKVRDKRAAVLRLQTESLEQVAASYGVTTMTVRNWQDTYGTPAAPPKPSAPFLQQQVQTVQLPPDLETPQKEPGGDGGLDAARAALGGEPEPGPEAVQVEAERIGGAPPLPPLPPEKTLLMLTELATMMSCRMYAARLKVPWTDQLKATLALTPAERSDLETYAPYAVPLMGVMLAKYGMYIGAGIYAFVFWTSLTDRYATL